MRVLPNTMARHLKEALITDFRLCLGDVDITRHHPKAFLIRFQNRRSCEEVNAKGKFKCRGAKVCVWPWQSLTGALGAALFYKVRLVLDGVLRHVWQPKLVERIVARTCSLQCVDTNLLHPTDTRGVELWAWTANPRRSRRSCGLSSQHELWIFLLPLCRSSTPTSMVAAWNQAPDHDPHLGDT